MTDTEGRFQIPNVRAGGPYTITASLSGFRDERMENVNVGLGEDRPVLFKMLLAAVSETVNVIGQSAFTTSQAGTASNVGQDAVENLPTIARSIGDMARVNPFFNQTQSDNGDSFLSVAGTHNRYNNLQIDGAVNNDLFGLAASGTPGGQTGTQPISLDAIQELQLVVSPYDVRQGGFAGGSVNAITQQRHQPVFGHGLHVRPQRESRWRRLGRSQGRHSSRTSRPASAWADQSCKARRSSSPISISAARTRPTAISIDGSTGPELGPSGGCAAHHRHPEEQVRVRSRRPSASSAGGTTTTRCLSAPTSTFGRSSRLTVRHNYVEGLATTAARRSSRTTLPGLLLRNPGHDEFDRGSAEHDAGFDVQRAARHLPARARTTAADGGAARLPALQVDLPDGTNVQFGTENSSHAERSSIRTSSS